MNPLFSVFLVPFALVFLSSILRDQRTSKKSFFLMNERNILHERNEENFLLMLFLFLGQCCLNQLNIKEMLTR